MTNQSNTQAAVCHLYNYAALLRANAAVVPDLHDAIMNIRAMDNSEIAKAHEHSNQVYAYKCGHRDARHAAAELAAAAPSAPVLAEPAKFVRMVDGVPCITVAEHKHLMAQQPVQGGGDAVQICEQIAIRHHADEGTYAAGKKAGALECAEAIKTALPSAQPAPQAQQALTPEQAYEAGWIRCANWMEREDLIADIGSPAYLADMRAALSSPQPLETQND